MQSTFIKQTAITAAVLSALAVSSTAHSAGFYLNEHSANGLGRAFAGQAALAENATVLYSNPAAMSQFKQTNSSFFISYVEPGIDVDGNVTLSVPGNTLALDASHHDISASEIIPAAFYVTPLNDRWSFGLGFYANFGLSTDFDDDYNALHFADKAEITSLNITPALSYKVSEQLSVGLGVSFNHTEAELGTSVPAAAAVATANRVPANATLLKMDGDDWSLSWNLGLLWQPTTATDIGFNYRSHTKLKLAGDVSSDLRPQFNQGGSLNLDLPDMAELAISHQISPRLSVQSSIHWFGWNSFDVLTVNFDDGNDLVIGEEHFENNRKYSLGTTYLLNERWTLRAGLAFDEGAATREHRTLSIPDTDRRWLSVGATYRMSDRSTIDFALLRVKGKAAELDETEALGPVSSTLTATQRSSATIASVQWNIAF